MKREQASDYHQELLDLYDDLCPWADQPPWFPARGGQVCSRRHHGGGFVGKPEPELCWAQQVAKDDPRIKTEYLEYASPKGAGTMRGYLAWPAKGRKKS